jgi:hypothetical protein
MDKKRRRQLTVLLSVTVLVSLTLACSLPGMPSLGDVAPGEEETPTVATAADTPASEPQCGDGVCDASESAETCAEDCAAPEGETPEPPPPPEDELPFDMDMGALENLDSYAYTFRMDGLSTLAGAAEELVLNIEGKRQTVPTRAEHLMFSSSSDGDAQDMEMIYIEDLGKVWMSEGGEAWQELPVMDDSMLQIFDAFNMFYWWDALFVGDPEDAQYLGQEVMGGVPSHHYRSADSASWGGFATGCTFASVEDEIWIAVDGSYPVKRQFSAEGDCQGESGSVNFLMEIRDVNQPQNINPPM